MAEYKVVGWTDYESDYPCKARSGDELSKILNALKEEISSKGYCFSGNDHQFNPCGVPVFSDGTCIRMSMRAWGYLMASIYSDVHGINLSYMDYYMDVFGEEKLPEYQDINVEPAKVSDEDYQYGIIIEEDNKILSESLSMGMELMTLDKVLKVYMELLKQENK